jgi:ring-1,2-phenylacetyl-CoA epoxidase subunit PaaD
MKAPLKNKTEEKIRLALEKVMDPEIPIISVIDLGIISSVKVLNNEEAEIKMTPTFLGCPALELMKSQIKEAIETLGYAKVDVQIDRTITWNSDMISETGKNKLENFGLGRPEPLKDSLNIEMVSYAKCPYCKSDDTVLKSPFGSALCRSIHFCNQCQSSFERFKPVE